MHQKHFSAKSTRVLLIITFLSEVYFWRKFSLPVSVLVSLPRSLSLALSLSLSPILFFACFEITSQSEEIPEFINEMLTAK